MTAPSADPAPLIALDDYERAARERIAPAAWEYIQSGAADEHTLRWNREAYARIQLSPRVLNDVSRVDTSVRVLDCDLPHPILLAPIAAQRLAHPEGEVATARGARAAGAGMVLSSYTSRPVEDVIAAGVRPLWFQLYMQERSATRDLVSRVADAGCTALCVTVDTPTSGARDRQARSGFEFPAGLPYRTVEPGDNPCTWEDIAWIRDSAGVPVILKGILHPDDAELAIQSGAAAIVVSNHGGRNLDTLPPAIDALPRVVERVRGRVPVLVDGGIRRGTDVLKAIALGASAVLIGRPYVYGLAVGGAGGVEAVVQILRRELEQAMALTGRARMGDVDGSTIWRA
ncbi:MAG: alpha-hydroxy acid oxidase [Gemmatimonadaceae bacterium]